MTQSQGIDWGLKFNRYVDRLRGEDGQLFSVDPAGAGDMLGMQEAIDACVDGRGDVIVRKAGGEEVTETIAFNKQGISVVAEGYGATPWAKGELFSMYAAEAFTDGPVATITKRCYLEGLGFVSRDTGATFYSGAAVLIGGLSDATPFGTYLRNCRFPKWNLDNRIGLAVEGSSDVVIDGCDFEGVGADFDSGIYVQGATANITIINNRFRDCTYAILFGSFAGGGPDAMIGHNICMASKLLSAGSAAVGIVFDNWLMTATDTGSYNDTVDNLNTLGLQFSNNHYAE